MFLCKTCHGPNEPYRLPCDRDFPMTLSYGRCEQCKKDGGCVDCHENKHGKVSESKDAELDCAA